MSSYNLQYFGNDVSNRENKRDPQQHTVRWLFLRLYQGDKRWRQSSQWVEYFTDESWAFTLRCNKMERGKPIRIWKKWWSYLPLQTKLSFINCENIIIWICSQVRCFCNLNKDQLLDNCSPYQRWPSLHFIWLSPFQLFNLSSVYLIIVSILSLEVECSITEQFEIF